eukprot:TRINITY_DN1533_c0_g2_i5.p2 TRINITY_DN1533_c0_g2~~TRINITY_DN1533_c0_g2_i5.p2  ORF type:complete len:162 (-),score=39.61 TRINITY_DN1533_c0_g2_i5:86-571(-)
MAAEALCLRAKKHGTHSEVTLGVSVYRMTCEAGFMVTCENASQRWISIEIDCSDSQNMISSRDSNGDLLFTCDVVPPMTKQVLMVISPKEGVDSYSYSMRMAHSALNEAVETHMPQIDDPEDPFQGIHTPIPDPTLLCPPAPDFNMGQVLNQFLANNNLQQ